MVSVQRHVRLRNHSNYRPLTDRFHGSRPLKINNHHLLLHPPVSVLFLRRSLSNKVDSTQCLFPGFTPDHDILSLADVSK